jgi:hypothetical protein
MTTNPINQQDVDGKNNYATLCRTNQVEKLDSYVHGKLLYLGKLCFSQGERVNKIREENYSLVASLFGVGKKFIEQVQIEHQTIQEQLRKSQSKYKTRNDKFCIALKGTNPSKAKWIEVGM